MGRHPTEAEGLAALLAPPPGATGWQGPYIDDREGFTDPWSRPYLYRFPGATKPFDLTTQGRDGRPGGNGEVGDLEL